MVISEMRRNCALSSALDGLSGLPFGFIEPRFATRTVAFGAPAAEEFGHSRAGPAPALACGEAFGVKMVSDGLWRSRPRRFRCFDFGDNAPDEGFYLLSSLHRSMSLLFSCTLARTEALCTVQILSASFFVAG